MALGLPRRVGIFWDYSSVKVPYGHSASSAVNRLRETIFASLPQGSVIDEMKLYANITSVSAEPAMGRAGKEMGIQKLRSGLDLSGFTVIDCPDRAGRSTLDKKIIVDCMRFGTRASDMLSTVVLISGDGDYSYLLSILRNDRVTSIVIHRGLEAGTSRILTESCDLSLHWEVDVLIPKQVPRTQDAPKLHARKFNSFDVSEFPVAPAAAAAAADDPPKQNVTSKPQTAQEAPVGPGAATEDQPPVGAPNFDVADPRSANAVELNTLDESDVQKYARAGYAQCKNIPYEEVTDEMVEGTKTGRDGYALYFLETPKDGVVDGPIPCVATPPINSKQSSEINLGLEADFEEEIASVIASMISGNASACDTLLALIADEHQGEITWVYKASLALAYYRKTGVTDNARFKAVIDNALQLGLIEAKGSQKVRLTQSGWRQVNGG